MKPPGRHAPSRCRMRVRFSVATGAPGRSWRFLLWIDPVEVSNPAVEPLKIGFGPNAKQIEKRRHPVRGRLALYSRRDGIRFVVRACIHAKKRINGIARIQGRRRRIGLGPLGMRRRRRVTGRGFAGIPSVRTKP